MGPSGETLLYILNHNKDAAEVELPEGAFTDLLSAKPCQGKMTLPGYGVAILAK